MSQYEDRLKDYVDVKERIRLFYEKHPDGRLVTEWYEKEDVAGDPYIIVRAAAYRTPDDPLPARGMSWMKVPGTTNFTRGSELENTETSAWGRAIGALGIGIDKSIASANEIANKEGEPDASGALPPIAPPNVETEELVGIEKRSGMVRLGSGNGYKLEARQGPEGHVIGFRLETDKGGLPQIVVAGPAGEALFMATSANPGALRDTRITIKGRVVKVSRPGTRSFFRMHVTDWEWDGYKFPADDEPEPVEAETAALFTGPEFDAVGVQSVVGLPDAAP